MQRKRESDEIKAHIFPKEINFSIFNRRKLIDIDQKKNLENDMNDSQSYPFNFENKNVQKLFDDSLSSCDHKIQINSDYFKRNLISHNSFRKNTLTEIKYFDVKKNIIDNCSLDPITNKEIKVFKNNKTVYINGILLNSYSTSRAIKKAKKLKKINFLVQKKTSSKYRGVSKNGNKWQVLMTINKKKYYIGSYLSEELAARIYDIYAIKYKGTKARTNFFYNNNQIKEICEKKINIKSDNLSDIMKIISN